MHYKTKAIKARLEPVSKFLAEMGLPQAESRDSLQVTQSGLPSETQVIVLNHQG
jgi:hypothetical protein